MVIRVVNTQIQGFLMWNNITNYSKMDDKTVVRTTELILGSARVVVTKFVGYGDELVMSCNELGINEKPLGETDMIAAQAKALLLVAEKTENISNSMKNIRSALNGFQSGAEV